MPRQSIAEIITARRAKIDEFDADPSNKNFDLSPFTDVLDNDKHEGRCLRALELIQEGV
jgi:hypothetical protein